MSDFDKAWALSRQRFVDEIKDLNDAQLRWKLHNNALSIGQMAIHVAGVETSFGSQLAGMALDEEHSRLKAAATEGVVNDNPFPVPDELITAAFVQDALAKSKAIFEPLITDATPQTLQVQIKSALGPIITGEGAFARLGFHSAYHQGQAYLMKTAPGFPK